MKICVIGTGTMAKGIVKAFAAQMPIVMKSRTQASLDKAMASISKGYGKLIEKGKMTQEAVDALLANITTTLGNARMLVCGCVATWKSCPIFQTPEGKFLIASLMQAAEHILQTEEFIVQKRDPRWRQINQVWQDANREPEKTE